MQTLLTIPAEEQGMHPGQPSLSPAAPPEAAGRSRAAALMWPFFNRRERRLRAAWRIVAMLVLYLALTIATMTAVETFFVGIERVVAPVALMLTATLAAWLPAHLLDRRPLRSLGLAHDANWWREFVVGLLLGLLLTGGVLVIYLVAGWATVTGWFASDDGSFIRSFSILVATYAAVAYLEELLFRGYFITNAIEGFSALRALGGGGGLRSRWWAALPASAAVAISSLVFAHFHGDTLTVMQYGHFWLAGVLLAIPYVLTGRLALPIGLHLTFNVGVTGLFNVEGGLPALVRLQIDGPAPWVGEAGLIESIMIVVTAVVTLAHLKRSGVLDNPLRT